MSIDYRLLFRDGLLTAAAKLDDSGARIVSREHFDQFEPIGDKTRRIARLWEPATEADYKFARDHLREQHHATT